MCGVYVKHNDALGVTVVLTCAVAGETTTFVKSSCNNRPDPSTIRIGFFGYALELSKDDMAAQACFSETVLLVKPWHQPR